jgi:hypothetical protein
MERIKTCFLKKEEIYVGNVTEVMAIELVKNNNSTYYVFENLCHSRTGKYSKSEIAKVWMDDSLASDIYELAIETKTSATHPLFGGYTFVQDGDNLTGLSHLLDYTKEYVDGDSVDTTSEIPKVVFTEQHRKLEV